MSFLLNSSIIPMLVSMDWFTTILSARSSHCIFDSLVSLSHWVHQICCVNVHACATRAGLEIGRANVQGEHLERGELRCDGSSGEMTPWHVKFRFRQILSNLSPNVGVK